LYGIGFGEHGEYTHARKQRNGRPIKEQEYQEISENQGNINADDKKDKG